MAGFGIAEAEELLSRAFAPWVTALGLKPLSFDAAGGDFLMPANPRLVHVGGVVCGQATAAAADTCSVVAMSALNGRFRLCTTVDLTTHFIRPLPPGEVAIRVDLLSNGKRMAFTRVELRSAADKPVSVSATGVFAYLED
jgi:acyl-coenzyme A thioesterase PaaI-like protein